MTDLNAKSWEIIQKDLWQGFRYPKDDGPKMTMVWLVDLMYLFYAMGMRCRLQIGHVGTNGSEKD